MKAVLTTSGLGETIQKLTGVQEGNFEWAVKSLKIVIRRTIEGTLHLPLSDAAEVRASQDYENFAALLKQLKNRHGTGAVQNNG